jgi:hypothetical protein
MFRMRSGNIQTYVVEYICTLNCANCLHIVLSARVTHGIVIFRVNVDSLVG